MKIPITMLFIAALAAPVFPAPANADTSEKIQYVDKLPERLKPAVFFIRTGSGSGSGFLAKLHDKKFLITNLHVLYGAKNIEATNRDGVTLKLGNIFGAEGHDVAIIEVTNPEELPVFDAVETTLPKVAKVNEPILVPGNSLGGATMLQSEGTVAAFGAKVIEHNAPVFQGNSGSPIVSQKTWKVLGVMAYANKVDKDAQWIKDAAADKGSQIKSGTRYFGFRLDSVKSWYPVNLSLWQLQCASLDESKKRILAVASFYSGRTEWRADPEISKRYAATVTRLSKLSAASARKAEATSFLDFLRERLDRDTKSLAGFEASAYSYLKDGDINMGGSSAALKRFGSSMNERIRTRNEEVIAGITSGRVSTR